MTRTHYLVLILTMAVFCVPAFADGQSLSNHVEATQFLDRFEDLAGSRFNPNLPFEDHYHFDGGQKILGYIDAYPSDTNIAERVIHLARSWANMEHANEEMAKDDGNRLVHLWFTRTLFAWTVLLKFGHLREGMKYDDAIALLGKPRGHQEAFNKDAEVMWVLGGNRHGFGLRTQTWIRAKVDSSKTILHLEFRRT